MKACLIFLTWSIFGVVFLLGLSSCNHSNLPTNEIAITSPSFCLETFDLVPNDSAVRDTQLYADKVQGFSSSPGITIDGFKKVSFRITNDFIKAIDSLVSNNFIVLDPSLNDSAWIMPAMEKTGKPDKNNWEVVHYFACYSQINGKKGPAVYYKIPSNQKALKNIPSQLAKDNIDSLYKYRQRYFQPQNIICPKGFGLPWCDTYNIFKAVDENPGAGPKVKGILAIKNPAKDSITLFLYTSKRPKLPKSSQTKKSSGKHMDGDEDGYYDFMFPCPNSCIP